MAQLRRAELLAAAEALIERFGIGAYRDQPAQFLPQGVRKLLDIAMAIVRTPRLLLLDEPTSGISVEEKFSDHGSGSWRRLRHERVAVMFIEHDMDIVARYAQRRARPSSTARSSRTDRRPSVLGDPEVQRRIVGMPTGAAPPLRAPRHEPRHRSARGRDRRPPSSSATPI